jgi:hypothetical protein
VERKFYGRNHPPIEGQNHRSETESHPKGEDESQSGECRKASDGRAAHREQIEHLLAVRERGIVVRVVPALQTRVLVLHSFLWMRFTNTTPVVHVEMNSGAQFLHDQDADAYATTLQRLDRIALSDNESRKLMAALSEGA